MTTDIVWAPQPDRTIDVIRTKGERGQVMGHHPLCGVALGADLAFKATGELKKEILRYVWII